jgi:hypothetical protein
MRKLSLFVSILLVLAPASAFAGGAGCTAENLTRLGINNVQATALGCDMLVGNVSVTGNHAVSGNGTVGGTLAVTGATTATGAITATAGVLYPAGLMETKAAAGSDQSDAGALTAAKFIHMVTGANETTGVKLPACAAANIGELHFIMNTVANKFLKIWPNTGAQINGGGANAVYNAGAAGHGGRTHLCACQAANTWYCG